MHSLLEGNPSFCNNSNEKIWKIKEAEYEKRIADLIAENNKIKFELEKSINKFTNVEFEKTRMEKVLDKQNQIIAEYETKFKNLYKTNMIMKENLQLTHNDCTNVS